jgi:catalase
MMVIGEVGDDFADSSRAWGSQRQRVNMGTLTLDKIAEDQLADCEHISFNPMRLIDGIEASDDPLLLARRATYEASRTARDGTSCPFSRS